MAELLVRLVARVLMVDFCWATVGLEGQISVFGVVVVFFDSAWYSREWCIVSR